MKEALSPPKDPRRPASVRCMAHSVASFMVSCSARGHHKPRSRTHYTPSTRLYGKTPYHPNQDSPYLVKDRH
ncbi:hypothetical protein E2C01_088011 [Portunus trituberculatus]|uniref:Uncharacterized protein n=1 Tax=Portunus trituberculatus TaxID=210409 RepID=A0A5B7JIR5_PORTR|nr:hypothetical protein [Portunus trituberculatus]